MELLFSAVTPDTRWSVSVSVSTEGEHQRYWCEVKLDKRYVTASINTLSQDRMLSWVEKEMREAMRRCVTA
jgi:hypothetical protein